MPRTRRDGACCDSASLIQRWSCHHNRRVAYQRRLVHCTPEGRHPTPTQGGGGRVGKRGRVAQGSTGEVRLGRRGSGGVQGTGVARRVATSINGTPRSGKWEVYSAEGSGTGTGPPRHRRPGPAGSGDRAQPTGRGRRASALACVLQGGAATNAGRDQLALLARLARRQSDERRDIVTVTGASELRPYTSSSPSMLSRVCGTPPPVAMPIGRYT